MPDAIYPSFCPVAMAADIIEPRWTLLILSELWAGATRFRQIQCGVPGMSPSLLSKRLKDMERKGLVRRHCEKVSRRELYLSTPMADELQPIVRALGEWAHRNIERDVCLKNLDARVLMWNLRRKINTIELPIDRCTVQFRMDEPTGETKRYWLVFRPAMEPDLCFTNPGECVDLEIISDLRALTAAWMGRSTFEAEIAAERIVLIGNASLARSLTFWLIRSSYAECTPGSRASCENASRDLSLVGKRSGSSLQAAVNSVT